MWWRIFIPTWRFFDRLDSAPELWVLRADVWVRAYTQPPTKWHSLFFNPEGNLFHARNNLLQRLLEEMNGATSIAGLVSYRLICHLAQNLDFKIIANGEEVLKVTR